MPSGTPGDEPEFAENLRVEDRKIRRAVCVPLACGRGDPKLARGWDAG
jgi:hypothetical protein